MNPYMGNTPVNMNQNSNNGSQYSNNKNNIIQSNQINDNYNNEIIGISQISLSQNNNTNNQFNNRNKNRRYQQYVPKNTNNNYNNSNIEIKTNYPNNNSNYISNNKQFNNNRNFNNNNSNYKNNNYNYNNNQFNNEYDKNNYSSYENCNNKININNNSSYSNYNNYSNHDNCNNQINNNNNSSYNNNYSNNDNYDNQIINNNQIQGIYQQNIPLSGQPNIINTNKFAIEEPKNNSNHSLNMLTVQDETGSFFKQNSVARQNKDATLKNNAETYLQNFINNVESGKNIALERDGGIDIHNLNDNWKQTNNDGTEFGKARKVTYQKQNLLYDLVKDKRVGTMDSVDYSIFHNAQYDAYTGMAKCSTKPPFMKLGELNNIPLNVKNKIWDNAYTHNPPMEMLLNLDKIKCIVQQNKTNEMTLLFPCSIEYPHSNSSKVDKIKLPNMCLELTLLKSGKVLHCFFRKYDETKSEAYIDKNLQGHGEQFIIDQKNSQFPELGMSAKKAKESMHLDFYSPEYKVSIKAPKKD